MVSALVSGLSSPGSSPGPGHCVVFLGKKPSHCLSPPRSINGYRRQNAGANLRWTSIPSRGSSNTSSWLHATETGISSGSVGQFGPSAAVPYLVFQHLLGDVC